MRCQCSGCKHHERQCDNHEGQLSMFDSSIVVLVYYRERCLCDSCLPKPAALPSLDLHYSKREAKRLAKQETLFLFM